MDIKTGVIAANIAAEYHKFQKRWNGDPYITHTTAVANSFQPDDIRHAIGHLYDVVEDCNVTLDQLRMMLADNGVDFTERNIIINAVDCLTHRVGESYLDSIVRVLANRLAISVKLADIENNLKSDKNTDKKTFKPMSKHHRDKYLLARFILLQHFYHDLSIEDAAYKAQMISGESNG